MICTKMILMSYCRPHMKKILLIISIWLTSNVAFAKTLVCINATNSSHITKIYQKKDKWCMKVINNKNFKEVCNKKMIEGITDDFIEIKYTTKSGSFNSESREKFFDSWYENFKINRYTGDYTHAVIIKYKAKAKEDEPIVHEGNCKVRQKKF